MPKVNVKTSSDMKELRRFIKKLQTLEEYTVEAGYYQEDKHPDHDIDMAALASIHEYGGKTDSGAEIPSRDFLHQSFNTWQRGNKDKTLNRVFHEYIMQGKNIRSVLPQIGKELTWMINWIIDVGGDFTPNSDITIMYKGSTQPLVETGYMKDHARYKVVKKVKED